MTDEPDGADDDYIRVLYLLQEEEEPGAGTTAERLADRLGTSPRDASAALGRLAVGGHVVLGADGAATLSDDGLRRALELTRRHRLLEQFLVEVLGVPWEHVHDEADRLEHALSEEVEARIASRLGHPLRDPHGDPIPSDSLFVSEPATVALDQLPEGTRGRFVRIRAARPALLLRLSDEAIRVGDRLEVVERRVADGTMLVRIRRHVHAIEPDLAAVMRIEVER